MGTSATIAVRRGDTVYATTVHWDGYPEYVGKILASSYNSLDKATDLILLGDLSSLGNKLKPEADQEHSFLHPAKDVCVAYHRDRGENLEIESFEYSDDENLMAERLSYMGTDFTYVWNHGMWYIYRGGKFISLRKRLNELEVEFDGPIGG